VSHHRQPIDARQSSTRRVPAAAAAAAAVNGDQFRDVNILPPPTVMESELRR